MVKIGFSHCSGRNPKPLPQFPVVPSGYVLGALTIRSYIKDAVAYCKKHKELVKIPVCSMLWMVNNHKNNLFVYQNQGGGKCETRDLLLFSELRKDKYSSKRDKYFVDFKYLESTKEPNEEMEEHTERIQAPSCSSLMI